MKLIKKELQESITRKKILKELNFILNNFKLLNEENEQAPRYPEDVRNELYGNLDDQSDYDGSEERQYLRDEEIFAAHEKWKKYCASEAGNKDLRCAKKETAEWHMINCRANHPGTIAFNTEKSSEEMNFVDVVFYSFNYKIRKGWKCVPEQPNIECPNIINPITKQKMRPLRDRTTGEFYCSDAVTEVAQAIEYYSTTNSNSYRDAVDILKSWLLANGAYENFKDDEEIKKFIESEQKITDVHYVKDYWAYSIDNDGKKKMSEDGVPKNVVLFRAVPPIVVNACRIIINPANIKNYVAHLCDTGVHTTDISKGYSTASGMRLNWPEQYREIINSSDTGLLKIPDCVNGDKYLKIAEAIVGLNASSRMMIQSQEMVTSNIISQWIQQKLTWFDYLPDDWEKIQILLEEGRYSDAAFLFFSTFAVIDFSGFSDIMIGIILISRGEVLAGILSIAMGALFAAPLIGGVLAKGAVTPALMLGREKAAQEILSHLAYRMEDRILLLSKAESMQSRELARKLAVIELRAQEAIEKNMEKDLVTGAEKLDLKGQGKEILENVTGAKLTSFQNPLNQNAMNLMKEGWKQAVSVQANKAGLVKVALGTTIVLPQNYDRVMQRAEEVFQPYEREKIKKEAFLLTCNQYEACDDLELDTKKEEITFKEPNDFTNVQKTFIQSAFKDNVYKIYNTRLKSFKPGADPGGLDLKANTEINTN